MLEALDLLRQRLTNGVRRPRYADTPYAVPNLWIDPDREPGRSRVDPYRFYLERIDWIAAQPPEPRIQGESGGEWSQKAVVYNTLIRAATGFDHSGDGKVSRSPIADGWMETGTFLKSIATLPLVKRMGFNTIHLLPVTAIGDDGHKGTLGSVYAIRNPYRLDLRLSEPTLELRPEDEFAAYIEAAHHLGLRVIVEFVFRTASKDADWVAEHPEWFYWIRSEIPDREPGQENEEAFGAPIFSKEELKQIKSQVERGELDGLIPPPQAYRDMFTLPPDAEDVEMIDGSWIGVLKDGTRVRIPGAFADWPPDDPQPPWTDVTYLRLYDHPDFNYMAYNTLRKYDRRLARQENRVESLWDRIVGILPYYQRHFGIDGVMIDMGHALPMALKRRFVTAARDLDPDFAFWDENFDISHQSREEGYNAVLGSYWWLAYRPKQLVVEMLSRCANWGYPIPFLAAPENHNTPRAVARPGGLRYARLVWALGSLLPAIPFCHAGFEVAESWPVNTGLDFQPEELPLYPADELPLFSEAAYAWGTEPDLVDWIKSVLAVRADHSELIADPSPATFDLIESDNVHVWAVARRQKGRAIAILLNLSWEEAQAFCIQLPTDCVELSDLITGRRFALRSGQVVTVLEPADCVILSW